MLLPIGHESNTVRRLPWVTFSIMGLCFIIHIFISMQVREAKENLETATREFIEYYVLHPYLELDSEIKDLLFGRQNIEDFEAFLSLYQENAPRDPFLLMQEQERLDELAEHFKSALKSFPYRKWGYTPARPTITGLFTHMFIHAGWLHLLGNLFFLYLTGPFIEDVWGRAVYAAFYIMMGILSSFMFGLHYPDSTVPLIGASGAIAGVMGAFLIRYWNTKIDFLFLIIVIRVARFKAPAWLMLPLWFLLELLNARVMDTISPSGGAGVAHWAHVWGFVFGLAAGIGLKFFKMEEKYIQPKIETKIGFADEGLEIVTEALGKKKAGFFEEAYDLLLSGAEKFPSDQDIVETLWDTAVELGRESEAAPFMGKLMEKEIRREGLEDALNHYLKLKEKLSVIPLSLSYKLTLFSYLFDRGEKEKAENLAQEIFTELNPAVSPIQLRDFIDKAAALFPAAAYKALSLYLQHPEIPDEEKQTVRERHRELEQHFSGREGAAALENSQRKSQENLAAAAGNPLQGAPVERNLEVFKAVPLGVKEGRLLLDLGESGQKFLPLDKIKVIAVVEILSMYEDPFILIDLFLDDLYAKPPRLRTIRLLSSEFDARKFFQKLMDPRDAVRSFISALLEMSGAIAHPDKATILLSPSKRVSDIKEYDRLLLT